MNKIFGYIRISPKMRDVDDRIEQIKSLKDINGTGLLEMFAETGVRGNVPCLQRPKFQQLCQQLKEGDQLVVWWLTEFGRDFADCQATLEQLLAQGVTVITVNQHLTFSPNSEQSRVLLKVLLGYAESETQHRLIAAEFGRHVLKKDPEKWRDKFRGRRANELRHQNIASALLEGKTLQQVADESGASISTVKRVKEKIRCNDELGTLRTPRSRIESNQHHDNAKKTAGRRSRRDNSHVEQTQPSSDVIQANGVRLKGSDDGDK